ncbi:MAG: DUF937 domain-containing protein [Alphaproteobacteria bacterium]|nr:DUF937 domain-containing protein [Alphaproteobacteria bacterium]
MLDKLIGAALQGLGSGGGGLQGAGTSPIMNIILQLLMNGMQGNQGGAAAGGGLGGLLGQVLGGGAGGANNPLGGLLGQVLGGGRAQAGGNPLEALAGAILGGQQQGGGLGGLLSQLQGAGLGREADSWVSQGANLPVSPDQLLRSFGRDRLQGLAQQNGMDLGEMLAGLSQQLPEVVNQMTPQGRMPETNELSDLLGQFLGRSGAR